MYAVILAGGSGTRFWPLSRELYSKQFLKIAGSKALLQQTLERLEGLVPLEKTYIVASEKQVPNIQVLFPGSDGKVSPRILVEPAGKNTAPAIGLAAIQLAARDPDAVMAVLPADHLITKTKAFYRILKAAAAIARQQSLVIFGVRPTRPETGYGYIRPGSKIKDLGPRSVDVRRVDAFVEKPDPAAAQRYLKSGRYYWNAGIFVWRASDILQEIKRRLPKVYRCLEAIQQSRGTLKEKEVTERAYRRMQSISIDYGVLEKADHVLMIEADIGWTDLGNWTSLEDVIQTDRRGNIRVGNVVDLGSRHSVIYASERLVATIGLDDMIVVDSPDATLVCPKERAQDVKKLVAELKRRGAPEHSIHQTVERPWGSYTVLDEGMGYKVKRIMVKPGGRLSLQLHKQVQQNQISLILQVYQWQNSLLFHYPKIH